MAAKRRLTIAMSGASGPHYGVRLLEILKEQTDIELHLIITRGAEATIHFELQRSLDSVTQLAHYIHDDTNLGSALASGTFLTDGMIVAPCSMKSLASIATGINDSLVTRAADVCLKERRRLVLLPRETPLHSGHLDSMMRITAAGGTILPPVPAFYHRPETIQDLVDHTVMKTLDLFGVHIDLVRRWTGLPDT